MKDVKEAFERMKAELPVEFAALTMYVDNRAITNVFNFGFLEGMKNIIRIQEETVKECEEKGKETQVD